MLKIYKIFEIGYLLIAIVFFVIAFTTYSTDKNKALTLAAFAVMAIFMFFFKRYFRKKRFDNNSQK